jgi:hypothetical protein
VAAHVRLEQVAHLAELGEHEGALAHVEQLGDELVEPVQLARPTLDARAVLQGLGGVVADLLEPGERGEHPPAPLHALEVLGVDQQLVDHLLVEHRLLLGELGEGDLLDLVGQVGQQPLVGLGAPQDERLGERAEPGRHLGVAVTFDRRRVLLAELLLAPEQPGVDRVEDRPQLGQPVLDRCAGEGELLRRPGVGARPWRPWWRRSSRTAPRRARPWSTGSRRARRCRGGAGRRW